MNNMTIYQQNRLRQLSAKFFKGEPFKVVTNDERNDPEFRELETLTLLKQSCIRNLLSNPEPLRPMKVLVKTNAAELYASWLNANMNEYMQEWYNSLKTIQGKWIYIETDHLYPDHVNTVGIPNVSLNGLKLKTIYFEAIDLMGWDYRDVERKIRETCFRECPKMSVDLSEWDRLVGAGMRRSKVRNRQKAFHQTPNS